MNKLEIIVKYTGFKFLVFSYIRQIFKFNLAQNSKYINISDRSIMIYLCGNYLRLSLIHHVFPRPFDKYLI